jgi:hypothetical protein
MKVGKLYRFEGFGYKRSSLDGQLAVYLGEDFIHREDGVVIQNHRILKVGAANASIIDRGMLKFMAEVEA